MNIKTITTVDGVNEVDFGSGASRFYWFQNLGTTTVHVSGNTDIVAGSDGVAELAAGDSVCIETLGGKVYVLGAGKVQIHNTGDKFCPFKNAPAQSGGEAVDAYTKSESDAKYAQKTDIPSSLPANGGNADTLGGKSPSDFVEALTIQQTNYTRILIPDNVDVKSWLLENAKIGTVYYVMPGCQGQINLPPMTVYGWAWFLFDGIRYVAKVMVSDVSAKYYLLDYINISGDWKEISTTPIRSVEVGATTDANGNFTIWKASSNRIPIYAKIAGYYVFPFLIFTADDYYYYLGVCDATSHEWVTNTAVAGTVYYIEI